MIILQLSELKGIISYTSKLICQIYVVAILTFTDCNFLNERILNTPFYWDKIRNSNMQVHINF